MDLVSVPATGVGKEEQPSSLDLIWADTAATDAEERCLDPTPPPLRYRGTARTADGRRVLVACHELVDTKAIQVTWVEPLSKTAGVLEVAQKDLVAAGALHEVDLFMLTAEDKIAACEAKVASLINLDALSDPGVPGTLGLSESLRVAAVSEVTLSSLLSVMEGPCIDSGVLPLSGSYENELEVQETSKPGTHILPNQLSASATSGLALLSGRTEESSVTLTSRRPPLLRTIHVFPSGMRAMVLVFDREDQVLVAATLADGRSAQLGVDAEAFEHLVGPETKMSQLGKEANQLTLCRQLIAAMDLVSVPATGVGKEEQPSSLDLIWADTAATDAEERCLDPTPPPLRYRGTARTADGRRVLVACHELVDTKAIQVTWVEPLSKTAGVLEVAQKDLVAAGALHEVDLFMLTAEDKIAACEAKVARLVHLPRDLGGLDKTVGQEVLPHGMSIQDHHMHRKPTAT